MSIVTRTGDTGTTGLMYNRRVSKSHPRVEAYGCVDELNSALGLARAALDPVRRAQLLAVQQNLVTVMGELATDVPDLPRYVADGFKLVTGEFTAKLDRLAVELEAAQPAFSGWAMPGGNTAGAALDLARTTCRRAERRIVALHEADQLKNTEIIVFLNRLADVLWLLARTVEPTSPAPPA